MELLKKLTYKNLKLNKKRSIVTIVGITLSVALLTALSTLALSFYDSMVLSEKQRSGNFHYCFEGMSEEDLAALRANRKMESIYVTSDLGYTYLPESKNEGKPYLHLVGTDADGMKNLSLNLISGRMPENDSEIVISRHIRNNARVELKVGDKITLTGAKRLFYTYEEMCERIEAGEFGEPTRDMYDGIDFLRGNNDTINEDGIPTKEELYRLFLDGNTIPLEYLDAGTPKEYTIVGLIERPSYGVEDRYEPGYSVFTYCEKPIGRMTVFTRFTKEGLRHRNEVVAGILKVDPKLYDIANSDKIYAGNYTQEEIEEIWAKLAEQKAQSHIQEKVNYYLVRYESLYPIDNTVQVLLTLVGIVAAIIVITSVFCIRNSFAISVTEKTKQFGMLASIGATKKQIRRSVLFEGFLLGIVGIPLGILSGFFASFVLIKVCNVLLSGAISVEMQLSISWIAIVFALLLGIVTIYLSALGSARRAAKISPISAIRNQNDIVEKKKGYCTPKWVRKLWGMGGVVSYKNMKRNRRKYRTSVVSIAVCTATFIAIAYFMSLGMDLVRMNVLNSDYNVVVSCHGVGSAAEEAFQKILQLEQMTEYNYVHIYSPICRKPKYTDAYGQYMSMLEYEEENPYVMVNVLSDEAYTNYLKKVGISDSKMAGKAILVNDTVQELYDEEIKDKKKYEMDIFDIKEGETLTLQQRDYVSDSEDGMPIWQEQTVAELPIAKITKERPLGFADTLFNDTPLLFVNEATWNSFRWDLIPEHEIARKIFIVTDQADELQDAIEEINDNGTGNLLIYNIDRENRQSRNVFLLIGIFAYGFIIVIALIGITNIINTVSTSMELRSREFAMLRSVGMTNREFNRMIRLESILMGGKALAFGIPIGVGISYLMYRVELSDMYLAYRFPFVPVLISIGVVFILLLGIMKMSLHKINHKNIIETIKDENV